MASRDVPEQGIDAIVLAAGRARRMGGEKILLPIDGEPMLAHVLKALRYTSVRRVIVLIRKEESAAIELIEEHGGAVVHPEDPSEGRAASLRAGIRASSEDALGWLFCMADQPYLTTEDYEALLSAFGSDQAGILHATYEGERGTPTLFAQRYREELLALRGSEGGRVVLLNHPDDCHAIEIDPIHGRDLDEPEDLN